MNVQCIRNKVPEIELFLNMNVYHVLCICEHWLSRYDVGLYDLEGFNLAGCFCRDRAKNGGVH